MQDNFGGTASAVRLKTVTSVAIEEEHTSSVMMMPVSISATNTAADRLGDRPRWLRFCDVLDPPYLQVIKLFM